MPIGFLIGMDNGYYRGVDFGFEKGLNKARTLQPQVITITPKYANEREINEELARLRYELKTAIESKDE